MSEDRDRTKPVLLHPVLPSSEVPTWPGAVWVGRLDLGASGVTDRDGYRLVGADGYRRARLAILRDRELSGFVEVDVHGDHLDGAEVSRAVAGLSPATGPRLRILNRDVARPVTVVVCTRDRVAMLRVALESILASDYPDFDVVVVDNASATDETRRYVDEFDDPRVRVVVEPRAGLSRARNAGLRAATGEIVAFTDDDVVVDSGWLGELTRAFDWDCSVACVCGIVPSGEIRTPAQAYFDQRVGWASSCTPRLFDLADPPADVPLFPFQVGIYGTGANFAVDRRTAASLGGFDEALGAGSPTDGGEDLDMFFRVLHAGRQLAYQPAAIVWHRHRADNAALAVQARGYGLGLGAWLCKIMLHPRTAGLAVRTAIVKVPTVVRLSRKLSVDVAPSRALADSLPPGIGAVELWSIAKGPAAYLRARREGRRRAPLEGLDDGCV
ncbi:glycosyltransferase family 2 protein [Rhodococcus sp. ABRD24]|uniref:glycosyltransferase family 2 protein n=1 Tax=Rhodococcus sp. ABRD24 TaxID=2507582 RepID=UPI00103B34CC|nr:glycosyltransferase family 2 protein [Rhodococcus sp. ABRD24]QBJ97633.1 glycosyltransferase family 2 protein [Rhodococcus sp. ABRD24]